MKEIVIIFTWKHTWLIIIINIKKIKCNNGGWSLKELTLVLKLQMSNKEINVRTDWYQVEWQWRLELPDKYSKHNFYWDGVMEKFWIRTRIVLLVIALSCIDDAPLGILLNLSKLFIASFARWDISALSITKSYICCRGLWHA